LRILQSCVSPFVRFTGARVALKRRSGAYLETSTVRLFSAVGKRERHGFSRVWRARSRIVMASIAERASKAVTAPPARQGGAGAALLATAAGISLLKRKD